MGLAEEIRARLTEAFAPERLEVIDDSESHRGHAGFREGGETHWKVEISSPALADKSRLARHRAIHAALGRDIIDRIHALSIDAR